MKRLHELLVPFFKGGTANGTKTFRHRLKFIAPLLLLLAVWCILSPAKAFADSGNPNPRVLPPNSTPFGHTYGEWSNRWWQWAFSSPPNINPVLDETGANCGVNQSGSVWFLAGLFFGGTATRDDCTVPAGKALFFPLANIVNFGANADCTVSNDTVETLREVTNAFIAAQHPDEFVAQIDGQALQALGTYRAGPNNPPFNLTNLSLSLINEVFGLQCTTLAPSYLAVSDGFYLLLAPLPPGKHTIHFEVPNFQDITYHLTVGS